MYLSKLELNGRDRDVQKDLSNAHKLHQRIMQAFPDRQPKHPVAQPDSTPTVGPRDDWNILFRQEPDSEVILVQSDLEPDWSKLREGYLNNWLPPKPFEPDQEQFAAGRILQFRLRANPSKRDNQTKKTIGLWHQADQEAWLQRQGDRCGFKLHGIDVIPSPNVFGLKGDKSAPIRISTALYQGILEVTESELFLAAVHRGIGRGKSYGCGLLSVARFQS
jgi:CRISPR system Cascade subunit CasE